MRKRADGIGADSYAKDATEAIRVAKGLISQTPAPSNKDLSSAENA